MNQSGITNRFIHAELLLPKYRIVGKLLTPSSGLLGLLSDTTRNILEIRQSQLAYINRPTSLSNVFDNARVMKGQVFAVCAERREDIGPLSLAHRSYASYQSYPVHICIDNFEIEMIMEWTGRFDLSTIVAEHLNSFVPGYRAVIRSTEFAGYSIQSPAVMVNFARMDFIAPSVEEPATAS